MNSKEMEEQIEIKVSQPLGLGWGWDALSSPLS